MKNKFTVVALLTLAISFYACQNDDDSATTVMDPTIISEFHKINSQGAITRKLVFDQQGRLKSHYSAYENTTTTLVYNDKDQVVYIETTKGDGTTKTLSLTYGNNERVTGLNDHRFELDETTNTYIEHSSFYTRTPSIEYGVLYLESGVNKFIFNEDNTYSKYCAYVEHSSVNVTTNETIFTTNYCELGAVEIGYHNGNLRFTSQEDISKNYSYSDELNPMYSSKTNLPEVAILLRMHFFNDWSDSTNTLWSILSRTTSKNNVLEFRGDPEDPESALLEYNYNEFGLPKETVIKTYYLGNLEREYPNSKYYYQGDDIPE